jgi:putative FmdB family regulatory protein
MTAVMPLFEYRCRTCGHQFEFLTRGAQAPSCPSCAGEDLQKQLSAFAVGASGGGFKRPDAAPAPCGMCGDPRGPGSCSAN